MWNWILYFHFTSHTRRLKDFKLRNCKHAGPSRGNRREMQTKIKSSTWTISSVCVWGMSVHNRKSIKQNRCFVHRSSIPHDRRGIPRLTNWLGSIIQLRPGFQLIRCPSRFPLDRDLTPFPAKIFDSNPADSQVFVGRRGNNRVTCHKMGKFIWVAILVVQLCTWSLGQNFEKTLIFFSLNWISLKPGHTSATLHLKCQGQRATWSVFDSRPLDGVLPEYASSTGALWWDSLELIHSMKEASVPRLEIMTQSQLGSWSSCLFVFLSPDISGMEMWKRLFRLITRSPFSVQRHGHVLQRKIAATCKSRQWWRQIDNPVVASTSFFFNLDHLFKRKACDFLVSFCRLATTFELAGTSQPFPLASAIK